MKLTLILLSLPAMYFSLRLHHLSVQPFVYLLLNQSLMALLHFIKSLCIYLYIEFLRTTFRNIEATSHTLLCSNLSRNAHNFAGHNVTYLHTLWTSEPSILQHWGWSRTHSWTETFSNISHNYVWTNWCWGWEVCQLYVTRPDFMYIIYLHY